MRWSSKHLPYLVFTLACSVLPLPPYGAHAATIYVDAAATGGNDGSSWASAFADLQDALEAAQTGDEIQVAGGVYVPGSSDEDSFHLKSAVAIYGGYEGRRGPGRSFRRRDIEMFVTVLSGDIDGDDTAGANGVVNSTDNISGGNSYHVVTGSGTDGTALLDGFTITAGHADIRAANRGGGGMYNDGGNPTLRNITFSGNSALRGGGMYNNSSSSPSLTNVIFSANSSGAGGGMYNDSSSSPSLTNVIFAGNSASEDGGGIYNRNDSSPNLRYVTFSCNSASRDGGGMYNDRSSPTLTNVTVSGNSAHRSGGGMDNDRSSPTLTNVTISGNSTSRHGGGMSNSNSSPTLTNVTVSGNSALRDGGGLTNASSSPIIQNSILWGNTAPVGPQISTSIHASNTIIDSLIQGGCSDEASSCTNVINADPLFLDPDGPDDIVGTLDDDLRLLVGSPAVDAGNDDHVPAAVATDLAGTPRFVDGDRDGTSTVDMGAFERGQLHYVDDTASGINDGSSWPDAFIDFQDALAAVKAGDEVWVAAGVYVPGVAESDTFQLVNGVSIFGGFEGQPGTESDFNVRDIGTFVSVLSGDIDGDDATDGSGIVTAAVDVMRDNINHVVTVSGTCRWTLLDGFTITGGQNVAGLSQEFSGGGIFNDRGNPTLINITLIGNSATFGGGMYNLGGNPTLANVVVVANTGTWGGGLHNDESSPAMFNVALSGNTASDDGGGMFNNRSSPVLSSVNITENTASDDGGGMFNFDKSSPILTNVFFSKNMASDGGGGMRNCDSSSPTLTGVTFSVNSASEDGGGMSNSSSSPTLIDVIFSGNLAVDSGGGIFNVDGSAPTLTNAIFSGNISSDNGGGMTNNAGSSPTLTNVTFSGNTAGLYGGGMVNGDDSSPTFRNCIFWGNNAPQNSQIGNLGEGVSPTINHSLVMGSGGSGAGWDSRLGIDGDGNIDADPLFVDVDGADDTVGTLDDNLRLSRNSPAIDTGNSSHVPLGITTDLDGDPRIINSSVDMGAFEAPCYLGRIIYVDANAVGLGTGLSWKDAFTSLQDALLLENPCRQIWVADGVYHPDRGASVMGGDFTATFQLRNGLEIYGGFEGMPGTEGELRVRDPNTFISVLSGDIETNDLTDERGMVRNTSNIIGQNSAHVVTGSGTDGTAILDGFTITAGHADGDTFFFNLFGGGMYNLDGNPALSNVNFIGNWASRFGGGMFNDSSSPLLTDVTFSNNSALEDGGGIYNYSGSSPALINVTISGNTGFDGGGIYNDFGSSLTLIDAILSGNSASNHGGGMYSDSNTSLTMTNVFFSNNSATGDFSFGGGLFNVSSSTTLTNVTFFGNFASTGGGGMYNGGSRAPLTNVIFSGNSALESGGGIYNFRSSPMLINLTVCGNSAANGGGIFNRESVSPTLINVTLSGNSASSAGGGMYNDRVSSPTIENSIFWENRAPVGSQVFNLDVGSDPTLVDSLVQGGCPDGQTTCTNVIDANPLFFDPDGPDDISGTLDDDLRLLADSSAVDAGNNNHIPAGITTDLAGNPRIADGDGNLIATVDMGAFEAPAVRTIEIPSCDLDGDGEVDARDLCLLMGSEFPADDAFLFFARCWQEEIDP